MVVELVVVLLIGRGERGPEHIFDPVDYVYEGGDLLGEEFDDGGEAIYLTSLGLEHLANGIHLVDVLSFDLRAFHILNWWAGRALTFPQWLWLGSKWA